MKKTLTKSELSRRWGVSRQSVTRLFQHAGAPGFDAEGRIAPDKADAWRESVKVERQEGGQWRRELDRLRAALLELELERATGKLVSSEEVARVAKADATAIRSALLAMPATLAPLLAGQSEPEAARAILDRWARETLQSWHDAVAGQAG